MYYFTEDCLIGISQIDEEHRHLFELINEVMELISNEIVEDKYHQIETLVRQLEEYADTHFEHEEAYMESIQDPELPIQKKQHAQFREKINMLDLSVKNTTEEQQKTLEDMLEYLTRWLYRHILSSDMMIGKMQGLKEETDICAFTEKYFTGVEIIDEEHRKLFEIIAEAKELIEAELLHDKYDEIVNILEQLREYTKVHFSDEEEYMESIQYSKLDVQKRAHQAFIEKLAEINLEEVDEHQQEYLEELIAYLLGWLINHILKADKLIGEEARRK